MKNLLYISTLLILLISSCTINKEVAKEEPKEEVKELEFEYRIHDSRIGRYVFYNDSTKI